MSIAFQTTTIAARRFAQRYNHDYVGTEHLLTALLETAEPNARNLLAAAGGNTSNIVRGLGDLMSSSPTVEIVTKLENTSFAKRALKLAADEPIWLTEHERLLLGLLRTYGSVAQIALEMNGVTLRDVAGQISSYEKHRGVMNWWKWLTA